MQISLKWVNELINVKNVELNNLIDKLTLGGFEVEEIIKTKIGTEYVTTLDISATANRADSLSIQGLALELSALLDNSLKLSKYTKKDCSSIQLFQHFSKTSIINKDCSGYITLKIKNLTNIQSPMWLKQKLIASGLTPENNLKDFQNYLLLETGYPFEFYDLDKIYSKLNTSKFHLTLTTENESENFVGNNGLTYKLNNSILTINANNKPISVAGIISSNDVHYSNQTVSLLIEASVFNAAKIRQQSRTLGIRTDRSGRYEKSLNNVNLLNSLYRLICLLKINNPNLACSVKTINQIQKKNEQIICLVYQNVKKILGPIKKSELTNLSYIETSNITHILNRLNFTNEYQKQDMIWNVTIPSLRNEDIIQEIDLIEEIGRIYGFDNFLTRLPDIEEIGQEDIDYKIRKKITTCLTSLGLNELIQYSLINQTNYHFNEIKLINPLVHEYTYLRSSLLPGLLKTFEDNIKNNKTILEGFEYGHIFSYSNIKIVEEKEYLAGIFGGEQTKITWSDSNQPLDWFAAKGKMEQLFQKLNLPIYWKTPNVLNEEKIFHPYSKADLYLKTNQQVGIFGQIHPSLSKSLNNSIDIYLFELNFELIKTQIQNKKLTTFNNYSSYPKILKDLSFIIRQNIIFNELEKFLYLNGSKFLIQVNVLDKYTGRSIPKNHISLCLQLTFQSNQETLTKIFVDEIIDNLKHLLITKFDASFRI